MGGRNILIVSANRLKDPYPVYPLGVSYLATYLSNNMEGWTIELFDFNLSTLDDFQTEVCDGRYDYICVSLRNVDDVNILVKNSFIEWYDQIIKSARQNSPQSKIIIGGAGYSIFPKLLFDHLKPDFGIHSEGELSLKEILIALDSNAEYDKVQGLVYRNGEGQTVVNERSHYESSLQLDVDTQLAEYYWKQSGVLNIQTKRGCPHHCIYCSYPLIEGSRIRTLDADLVLDNIKRMAARRMDYLFFTDSVFNISKEYNVDLAEKIIRSGVKINWGAYFSPNNLDKEELALYKRSGLTHIEFGTESFSDEQLQNYGKSFSFADVLTTSRMCYDLSIFYAHFLILGGYGETNATIDRTIENSKLIDHSLFFPYFGMRIYPGTVLSSIALREGLIDDESELIDPIYYVSKDVEVDSIKTKLEHSEGKWILPNAPHAQRMTVLRSRGRKGPLWEYLRY